MIEFNKDLVDEARKQFYKVYVDTETPEMFMGSETDYTGVRVRIYTSDWEYENPSICRSNEELEEFLQEYKNVA